MKVYVTSLTGVSDGAGVKAARGQTIDVPDQLGQAWIVAGHVCLPEDAPKPAPEKAGAAEARKLVRPAPARANGKHARGRRD